MSRIASASGFRPWLLDGVTGSGKTEVYIALARRALARGEQTLLLVPEIGLTPQSLARLRAGLGADGGAHVVTLHSGLTDAERLRAWHAARSGEAAVVVGTRSAALVPLARPGLVIVDEEHETSYRQVEGVRYHARDLAVVRARMAGCAVVLGSATPSLESLDNVRRGRYERVVLDARAGEASAPLVELLDVRRLPFRDGLSPPLTDAVRATVAAGEQALVFINRRGYAPTLSCGDCGDAVGCEHCDARLVYHRGAARMACHHCGAERDVPRACPTCGALELRATGVGSERVERALARALPGVRVARIDSSTTREAGALEAQLAGLADGSVQVAVGTQMLAKGHDFPRLTLVAIVDVDAALAGIDFRAPERLAQLLTQVAGRAGRGSLAGRVLVQTHQPDHPLLQTLLRGGYGAFARAALAERGEAGMPPSAAAVCLRADAVDPEAVDAFAATAAAEARRCAADAAVRGSDGEAGAMPAQSRTRERHAPSPQYAAADRRHSAGPPASPVAPVQVLGPVPAPMARRAGRERRQVWLLGPARPAVHRVLDAWLAQLDAMPAPRRVRWSVDVDPVDIF